MERYIKYKDIEQLLLKLYNEPAYQHEGEDFYSGVSTVDVEILDLPYIEIEESKTGKCEFIIWAGQKYYRCSRCGKDYPLPPAWNEYDVKKYLKYCSCCGAEMTAE